MSDLDVIIGNVLEDKDLESELKIKDKSYIEESIKKPMLNEYLGNGWETYKEYKTCFKVRKNKTHDVLFEDRVWSLLCKFGFIGMNKDRNFAIKYLNSQNHNGKQIDVFSYDSDVAICVECKSSEKYVYDKSFSTEINEINGIKSNLYSNIRKKYGSDLKVGYILAGNNISFTDSDIEKMKEYNIIYLTSDDISYFERIADYLGEVGKYQFLGKIFKGQQVKGLKFTVPAIKGEMGGGRYYSFSIEPSVILKLGYVLHRDDTTTSTFDTYQRMVNKSRVKEIGKYIDDGGFFPNNLIVNFTTKKPLGFDPVKPGAGDGSADLGILHLPNLYHSAFIIDGQHRLFGYGKSIWASKSTVPVVAFENLDSKVQTQVFVDINNKQKSVPRNLLLTIMTEFNWGSDDPKEAIKALKLKLIQRLTSDQSTPLYKRIAIAEEKKDDTLCMTQNYILSQAMNKVNYFADIKDGLIVKSGFLWAGNYEKTLEKSFSFLRTAFRYIEKNLEGQWNLGKAEGGFIAMNAGVCSMIRLFDDLILYAVINDDFEPSMSEADAIFAKCTKFLDVVIEFLGSLDSNGLKTLRSFVGGAAVERVLMEYRNAINIKFEEFNPCPQALDTWRKENSGEFNLEAKQIGDDLQLDLRNYIQCVLQKEYGVSHWWSKGVPKKIQGDCALKQIDSDSEEEAWNFMEVRHYEEIIRKEKALLLDGVTRNDLKGAGIDKRLYWVARYIKIRNKVAHPERINISIEELDFLKELRDWMIPKITTCVL